MHKTFILFLITFNLIISMSANAYDQKKYAFFIPEDNSQTNTYQDYEDSLDSLEKKLLQKQRNAMTSQNPATKKNNTVQKKQQKKQPIQKKAQTKPIPKKQELSEAMIAKIKQYQLLPPPLIKTPKEEKSSKPIKKPSPTNNLDERLDKLPFPDSNLPMFQQIYGHYCTDLRVLAKTKRLPKNYQQQSSLAKANTIRSFVVE